ncbi:MAG: response regulator [Syntrophobacteraceae bacterium]|nr:response regulator [Syntrophobacteraceae bacterium]
MPVIALFSGSCCREEEVVQKILDATGYELVTDKDLVAETSRRFDVEQGKLFSAMTRKASIFNNFTHEKERSLAYLKCALSDILRRDNLLLTGFAGLLPPREISHAIKICLIADMRYRFCAAIERENLSEKDALKKIRKDDESRATWVEYLYGNCDPWAAELYDLLIPMDKYGTDEAARLVCDNAGKQVVQVSDVSRQAVEDFALAARVGATLAREGHSIPVTVKDNKVIVTINKHVLMLSSLEDELRRIILTVPGVGEVETVVGPGYYQTDIYRKIDFSLPTPSKVLLVDDEREFVQTLSERLQMRHIDSAVVHGGLEALDVVDEDEPEVMVLDLKMAGVDGLEVLRRVKAQHPKVEIIVLTGHGSKEMEALCMEMGAYAYLEKPVDIAILTKKMQEAYRKLKENK